MVVHAKHQVLYDDTCGLCRCQMRWLGRLDWLHRFETVPISSFAQRAPPSGITREALEQSMHVMARDGTIHCGAHAVRFIALRLPLSLPLGLLLCLPGMPALAGILYQYISRHRHAWSLIR